MFRAPGRLFRTLAIAEAITWTILISAIIARSLGVASVVVTIGGAIHGFIFLAYGTTAVLVALNQRWHPGVTALAVGSAVIPFATIPTEIWLQRSRRLVGEWRLDASDDPRDARWHDRLLRWFLRRPWVLAALLVGAIVTAYVVLLISGPPGGK